MAELKVVPIVMDCASSNPVKGLRRLADAIEAGELEIDALTVCDGEGDVWHFDRRNIQDEAARQRAAWNLTNGIYRLQKIYSKASE